MICKAVKPSSNDFYGAGWMDCEHETKNVFSFTRKTRKSYENFKLKRVFSPVFVENSLRLQNSGTVKRTVALITLRRDYFEPIVSSRE